MMAPWPMPEEWRRHPAHQPAPGADADRTLAEEVVAELVRDERTRLQNIAVEVQNRVAILTGKVDTPDLMFVAGGVAWRTPGVVDVCNMLRPSTGDEVLGEADLA